MALDDFRLPTKSWDESTLKAAIKGLNGPEIEYRPNLWENINRNAQLLEEALQCHPGLSEEIQKQANMYT